MCMSRSSAVAYFLALLFPLGLSVSMIVIGKCLFAVEQWFEPLVTVVRGGGQRACVFCRMCRGRELLLKQCFPLEENTQRLNS